MWRSEGFLQRYRSASRSQDEVDPLNEPWRLTFRLIPELSFSSDSTRIRSWFQVNGAYDTASLYAQELWELFQSPAQTQVFEHSDGKLLAFEFIVSEHGLDVGLVTSRVTDRAAWRQIFSIHDMNGDCITDVDHIAKDWKPSIFRPPQMLLYPDSIDLDKGRLSLNQDRSAVILLDGYFHGNPNAVYRCVFRVTVEENSPSVEWSPLLNASASSSRTRTPIDWDEERDGPRGAMNASSSETRTPSDWDDDSPRRHNGSPSSSTRTPSDWDEERDGPRGGFRNDESSTRNFGETPLGDSVADAEESSF